MIPQAPGSSAHQRFDDAAQYGYVNGRVSAQPMTTRELNLDHLDRRAFTSGCVDRLRQTKRNKGRWHRIRRRTFCINNLASPAKQ
jgi:hypothetical protein